ncbi:MAG: glycosyltransferase family 2 protein [Pirellulales bacterium]
MTTTCLISNYNYAQFVGAAIDSALAQSVPFDEIIVVDDGSSDGSRDLLAKKSAEHPTVRVIAKSNGGQLSCFNEGFAASTGDIVFFLDGDDVYEPHYLERVLWVYDEEPTCDFLACGLRQFGQRELLKLRYPRDCDLGYSTALTALLTEWIGAPTSCLSMRRSILQKFLPLPFCEDWRTRADDCLVFASSLAGAHKFYVAQPLVRYRVHGGNHYCRQTADAGNVYRRRLAINRLFAHLERKLCYDVNGLAAISHREFCTIPRPTGRMLRKYLRIALRGPMPLVRRLECAAVMMGHYLKTAFRSTDPAPAEAQCEQALETSRAVLPAGSATIQAIALEAVERRAA